MKRLILSALLFTNLMPIYAQGEDLKAIVSPEPKKHAWWLRIAFTPTHKEIYGIPIKKLDPAWALASQLKKEAIPHDVLFENGQDAMARAGIDFIQSGDFNNDKIEDLALVGVFQDIQHQQGKFFLILARNKDGSWEKAFLRTWSGKPGFLGLERNGQHLVLWFCMECGGFSGITWDEKLKKYEIQKSSDEDL